MNEFSFGPLEPFIQDENITDINFNGYTLWIDHLKKGRYSIEDFEETSFMKQFCYKLANYVNQPFNVTSPLLEAETDELRISIIHESIAHGGNSISIRKTPALMRISETAAVKSQYVPASLLHFLQDAVAHHFNILVCGLPGVGKTELIKLLSASIPEHERVITIEDTLELRYHDLHPQRDCVAMKVNEHFTYADAIKAGLRQRPNWILVSEVRSREVVYLLESMSTGTHILSTLHCRSASRIPYRIQQMYPGQEIDNLQLEQVIYDAVDLGICVRSNIGTDGVQRYIHSVTAYFVDHGNPVQVLLYEQGKELDFIKLLPDEMKERLMNPQKKKRKKS
ncbi:MAG: CpaF family protein [Erysipelotrichaceae bacterium]|nr:CpaF family protein [Erysipelotrichaceae bacterium]